MFARVYKHLCRSCTYAPHAWKQLNGIFCIYKPAEKDVCAVRAAILHNLCKDLNKLSVRPPANFIKIEGNANSDLRVVAQPNLADHPLVVGDRYQIEDFKLTWLHLLGYCTSGLSIMAINDKCYVARKWQISRTVRSYHLSGELGFNTDTNYKDGKVVYRTTYKHATKNKMEKVLSIIQAAHHKKMYEYCGVALNSQEAYEIANQGLLRVAGCTPPILYDILLVRFDPPSFDIQVQCVNEYEIYFKTLIHDIGVALRTAATCTKIRCIRYGPFSLESALLPKCWNLQHIISAIKDCEDLLIPPSVNVDLIHDENTELKHSTSGRKNVSKIVSSSN